MWQSVVGRPVSGLRWAPAFLQMPPRQSAGRLYCLRSLGRHPSPSLAELGAPEHQFRRDYGVTAAELAAWQALAEGQDWLVPPGAEGHLGG